MVRRSLRNGWVKLVVGVLIGSLSGAAFVSAHGGDESKVHACVIPGGTPTQPNVRIVGANDSCTGGATALDWSIAGPAGPPGPPPSTIELRAAAAEVGFPRQTLSRYTATAGPFPRGRSIGGTATARCTAEFPTVVEGGYLISPASRRGVRVVGMGPVSARPGGGFGPFRRTATRDGYSVTAIGIGFSSAPWRVTATAVCSRP